MDQLKPDTLLLSKGYSVYFDILTIGVVNVFHSHSFNLSPDHPKPPNDSLGAKGDKEMMATTMLCFGKGQRHCKGRTRLFLHCSN